MYAFIQPMDQEFSVHKHHVDSGPNLHTPFINVVKVTKVRVER